MPTAAPPDRQSEIADLEGDLLPLDQLCDFRLKQEAEEFRQEILRDMARSNERWLGAGQKTD